MIKKRSNKKIYLATSGKQKRTQGQVIQFKADHNLRQNKITADDEHILAVGPTLKPNPKRKKSKLFNENRQYTSKTDDVYFRDGGEYIRKITQRTNTKISNFSEFPTPIQEKPVKLVQQQEDNYGKYRSRTVKRKNKGLNKFGGKITAKKNPNLKYYNIVTDLQKQKITPKNL